MSRRELSALRARIAVERAEREFAFCDTLDVKTSIVVAIIVFLASQSDRFLRANAGRLVLDLQYISVVSLILSGIAAIVALWPRNYENEASPSEYSGWFDDLTAFYANTENPEAAILDQINEGRAMRAAERAEKLIVLNKTKSTLMFVAFVGVGLSLAINLLTLAIHLF
jgi:hypothetical protein